MEIVKFEGAYPAKIPEGETRNSGPCLRDALCKAGISTDLSAWADIGFLPNICEALGLELYIGEGRKLSVPAEGEYILCHIVGRTELLRIAHFTHTTDLRKIFKSVSQEGLVAVIKVP